MIKKPRGTEDILPEDIGIWRLIEDKAREICELFGYNEIRTPVFEDTSLFSRGVGDSTDVVQKEMYSFNDKGGRNITLRPEGTASLVRSYIENSLYANPQPTKLFYLISCYRYEKPQSGRLREFHQFGLECFGSELPSADAEIIELALEFLKSLGINDLTLKINSIGCDNCKPQYLSRLKEYFMSHYDELCDTCKERLEKNPMRIIDCKSPVCREICKEAPKMIDYLCDDCGEHLDTLKTYLQNAGIEYELDPNIVRGLDYYTKTVFEITSDDLGAQSAVCGGGRYNGLVEELGGKPTPGIGFAMGLERIILILKSQKNIELPMKGVPQIFIAAIGSTADCEAQKITSDLRKAGIRAERDLCGRSVKAQMKYANKLGAKFCFVLGDDEISMGRVSIKNMLTGESAECRLCADSISKFISGTE